MGRAKVASLVAAVLVSASGGAACAATKPHAGQRFPATVVRVVDGDTLYVNAEGDALKVRLIDVDAPELAHGSTRLECAAKDAKAVLAHLALVGSTVYIASDSRGATADRYGRALRWLYRSRTGRVVQIAMASRGYVNAYHYGRQRHAYSDALDAASETARVHARGAWGFCAGPDGHGPTTSTTRHWDTGPAS